MSLYQMRVEAHKKIKDKQTDLDYTIRESFVIIKEQPTVLGGEIEKALSKMKEDEDITISISMFAGHIDPATGEVVMPKDTEPV